MIFKKNRKLFLNLFGVTVVTFWLVLIGMLIKKESFKDHKWDRL